MDQSKECLLYTEKLTQELWDIKGNLEEFHHLKYRTSSLVAQLICMIEEAYFKSDELFNSIGDDDIEDE